jgi:hypothetical protein
VSKFALRGLRLLKSDIASPYHLAMRLEIEFFRQTSEEPGGTIVRRNTGQFASERDVEIYGLTMGPREANGFAF